MNVQELIDALTALGQPDLEVRTQGCDCDGDAGSVGVETYPGDSYVMIYRGVESHPVDCMCPECEADYKAKLAAREAHEAWLAPYREILP